MKNLLFLKPGGGRTIYTGPALAFDFFVFYRFFKNIQWKDVNFAIQLLLKRTKIEWFNT